MDVIQARSERALAAARRSSRRPGPPYAELVDAVLGAAWPGSRLYRLSRRGPADGGPRRRARGPWNRSTGAGRLLATRHYGELLSEGSRR